MSKLKVAAASVTGDGSDIKIYRQKNISTTGFDVEEGAILSPYGLDTICDTLTLYHPPFRTNGEAHLRASLTAPKSWTGKDQFIQTMHDDYGVTVKEENHAYKPNEIILSVVGLDNILAFGQALRATYTEEHLEVDDMPRPVIHPELVGELMDDAVHYAEHSPALKQNEFTRSAYRPHDWQP
jgi:hypothetical protein